MDKKKNVHNIIFSLALALFFFILALYTIKDYGISWDETIHFSRGQAYLYYLLTGKTNYDDLPNVNLQGTFGKPENYSIPRRSFYQLDDFHNGDYYIYKDTGHPPINDILAAISNYIFFQKLEILDDISAYHLFNIFASSILVFVVVIFAKENFGKLGALFSFIFLCTYPLFWAESHFNIKDFPEAAFFAGFIWTYYKSLKNFSVKWLATSIIFFSLGLGVKFNVFFVIPIILVYIAYRHPGKIVRYISSFPRTYIILLFFAPLIVLGIFTATWPLLWHNWFENILDVVKFYKGIGTEIHYQPESFYFAGFNSFPILWILFTTPPFTLVLLLIGTVSAYLKRKENNSVTVLWLIWFLIPILRVTVPGSSIYGGIRQISEFVPAMALLSGIGALQLFNAAKTKRFLKWSFIFFLVFNFSFLVFNLIKLHPNENVYFNFLIGGLRGAQEKDFPSWGNSFGNAYLQGIRWINKNAPYGAKLSLIQGTRLNIPPILVRKDINYSSSNWSGIDRGGEYLMDLTFNDTTREFHYAWEYADMFLIPIYEVKVGGVPILKIWKNDLEHTKESAKKNEVELSSPMEMKKEDSQIILDLGKIASLSRLYLYFDPFSGCLMPEAAYIEISKDQLNWIREKDQIPFRQVRQEENMTFDKIEYFVAGEETRYIKFVFEDRNACPLNYKFFKVMVLE